MCALSSERTPVTSVPLTLQVKESGTIGVQAKEIVIALEFPASAYALVVSATLSEV